MTKKGSAPEKVDSAARGSAIRPCSCANEYQDKHYGKGMRVHCVGGAKAKPTYSCTVCGKYQ